MSRPTNGRSGTASVGQWLPHRLSKRKKLRNSTFIIPSTGERSRRHFTLRSSSNHVSTVFEPADAPDPGLDGHNHGQSRASNENDTADDNVNDDDDDDASAPSRVGAAAARFRAWLGSPTGRGVVKCTVAYVLASLWTFWPALSDLLGRRLDGKHLVCTITIYFHPARSAGAMLEATAIAVVAVAYAEVVSVLSMAASVLIGSVLGWVALAYAVVLVLFVGVAFGFIGWVKQRLNQPAVNVGCTLASLAIITVVTKENAIYSSVFSNAKIVQVLKTLAVAIATTATVSLLLWRVSARALLRASFAQASTALTDMLLLITHGFLSGAEEELAGGASSASASAGAYGAATRAWAAAHAKMTTNLRDAKYEHYAAGHAARYQLDKAVYKALEALAQSLGGLRSAANTQFALLREADAAAAAAAAADAALHTTATSVPVMGPAGPAAGRPQLARASSSFQRSGRLAQLAAIDEASDESSDERATPELGNETAGPAEMASTPPGPPPAAPPLGSMARNGSAAAAAAAPTPARRGSTSSTGSTATLRTSSETFELFIGMLGPSMKSLAFTVASILRDTPFGEEEEEAAATTTAAAGGLSGRALNARYRQSLADALALFDAARADALQELYKTIEFGRPRSDKIQADFEEVAAACGHFSFSLQAFAEETAAYLDVLDDLRVVRAHGGRSWRWLRFWEGGGPVAKPVAEGDDDDARAVETGLAVNGAGGGGSGGGGGGGPGGHRPDLVRPLRKSQLPRGIPDQMVRRRDTFSWQAAPQANAVVRGAAQRLLRSIRVLMRDDIRFGIKVGVGAVLWAMLAFVDATRATYMHWRGEWGLLSFMIVCSMTVGASNTTASARFLATLAGAGAAVVNWTLSGGRAAALLVLGAGVAFCCFVVMVDWGRAPVGRTTLLAYNVVTLYAYSLSQRDDDGGRDEDEGGLHPLILEIAKHRFLAVTAGLLWGLVVCRVVWPISARRRFQEGVSVLCLQMGLVWRRGPLAVLLQTEGPSGGAGPSGVQGPGPGPGPGPGTPVFLGTTTTATGRPVAVMAPARALAAARRSSYLTAREQAALRRYAARLDTLRQSAASEFELRGPFPAAAAARILAALNRVLDGFCAMSTLTERRGTRHLSEGERALLYYTAPERAMLCDRIGHVFQVLASSFMLEYPLSDALPDVDLVRDRLLAKIFQFRKEHALLVASAASSSLSSAGDPPPLVVHVEERDYALLYAYALITGQVAEELQAVAREFEGLFGVLDVEANLLQ